MKIFITGASSGVGAALAKEYAREGVFLFLAARSQGKLAAVAEDCKALGAIVEKFDLDVRDSGAVEDCIGQIEKTHDLDIVIGNAGVMDTCGPDGQIESLEKARVQIDTNLYGCINLVTAVVPYMQSRKNGQIVLMASLAGVQPIADIPAYCASKTALITYGEALGDYLQDQGIFVSVICPGYIKTAMTAGYKNVRFMEMTKEQAAEKIKRAITKKKRFVAFPRSMEIFVRFCRIIPASIRQKIGYKFRFTK